MNPGFLPPLNWSGRAGRTQVWSQNPYSGDADAYARPASADSVFQRSASTEAAYSRPAASEEVFWR